MGAALGLAVLSAVAAARTNALLAVHAAATAGFHRALLAGAVFLVATALIALRATNTRGEPTSEISGVLTDEAPLDAAGSGRTQPGISKRRAP